MSEAKGVSLVVASVVGVAAAIAISHTSGYDEVPAWVVLGASTSYVIVTALIEIVFRHRAPPKTIMMYGEPTARDLRLLDTYLLPPATGTCTRCGRYHATIEDAYVFHLRRSTWASSASMRLNHLQISPMQFRRWEAADDEFIRDLSLVIDPVKLGPMLSFPWDEI
jgi:hypothetical protein